MAFKIGDQFTIDYDKLIADGGHFPDSVEFYKKDKSENGGIVHTVMRIFACGSILVYKEKNWTEKDPVYGYVGILFANKISKKRRE